MRSFIKSTMLAVLMALSGLIFVSEASANTFINAPSPIYQGWIDEARVPTPSIELEVRIDTDGTACPGNLACSTPGYGVIDINPLVAESKSVFLHEIGHVFDFTVLTPGERERFAAILGGNRRTMPWWSESYDWSMGEWFADAYRQCARLPRIDPKWGYTVASGELVGWRLRRECVLIRYAGA